jgi:GntR family transcriptional regulator, rspAB operon transcriptional repressor
MNQDKEVRTLTNEAYQKIKQMVVQQRVAPGQRLVYKDLSDMLSMSRTPIINALNRLEQENLVASEAFRGFYVKPIDVQEAWDLFGVREALEAYAVEEAIKRGDTADHEILRQKVEAHATYMPVNYNRKKLLLDAEIHIQIAAMTKNKVLERHMRMNLEHVYLRFRLDHAVPDRMSSAADEHSHLLDKMKKKDLLESVEIIRRHVQKARDFIISCLSFDDEEDQFYQA